MSVVGESKQRVSCGGNQNGNQAAFSAKSLGSSFKFMLLLKKLCSSLAAGGAFTLRTERWLSGSNYVAPPSAKPAMECFSHV